MQWNEIRKRISFADFPYLLEIYICVCANITAVIILITNTKAIHDLRKQNYRTRREKERNIKRGRWFLDGKQKKNN